MKLQSCRFAIPFVGLFAMVQASAQSALEIPQPNSTQSGISIVSGWHCNASRVEVAFDGGERILVAYGTTRADTKGPCGDDNNGFSLLWAYNLLGSGPHEVVAYADGVEFGRAAFDVTDISEGGFLRDKSADVRVGVFPDFEHDVILEWQEANQNFVIADYLPSRDPYNVAGMWEMTDGASFEYIITMHPVEYPPDPDVLALAGLMSDLGSNSYGYAGVLEGDSAVIAIEPDTGAAFAGQFLVHFTGERAGTALLVECSPSLSCPVPVGTLLLLFKGWPLEWEESQSSTASNPNEQSLTAAPGALVSRSALDAAHRKLKELSGQ